MTESIPPKHIAIIMDGNSRWAKKKNLPKISGYNEGIKAAQNIIQFSKDLGVRYLTLYVFSIENWQRPKIEVENLMIILKNYLKKDIYSLITKGVRVIFTGDHSKLDQEICDSMYQIEEESLKNNFYLIIAISYSGRDEIIRSIIELCKSYNKVDLVNYCDIESLFTSIMNLHNIPNPDLLIRTGGEKRLSNFLLWQIAYTELYFTDKLWPDFMKYDLVVAINDFNKRERKYGR